MNFRPLPMGVVLLTGFLGAGKTTLLNRILAETHAVRTAVLVNDFGAVNIDASLVVDVRGDTIVLDNGCICCSVRGDLLGALEKLLAAPAAERVQRVVIEASGIADPRAILGTFIALDRASTVALEAMIAVVDASQLRRLDSHSLSLARDQLDQADLVILNKLDLAESNDLDYCREEISRFASRAALIETSAAEVPMSLLFPDWNELARGERSHMGITNSRRVSLVQAGAEEAGQYPTPKKAFYEEMRPRGLAVASSPALEADSLGRASALVSSSSKFEPLEEHGFWSVSLKFQRAFELSALKSLCVNLPKGIYRVKGVVQLVGHSSPVVLQVVGQRARVDRLHEGSRLGLLNNFPEDNGMGEGQPLQAISALGPFAGYLVVIGRAGSFDVDELRAQFDACLSEASTVDTGASGRGELHQGAAAGSKPHARGLRAGWLVRGFSKLSSSVRRLLPK